MSGRSPFLPLIDGTQAALTTAGLTAIVDPDEDDSLPYTTVGLGTVQTGWAHTKTSEGYVGYMDFASWAVTLTTAQSNADTGIQALTNDSATITVTGYSVIQAKLDIIGPPIKDTSQPNQVYWQVPYTIKYEIRKNP